jgi:hypothetical protein
MGILFFFGLPGRTLILEVNVPCAPGTGISGKVSVHYSAACYHHV